MSGKATGNSRSGCQMNFYIFSFLSDLSENQLSICFLKKTCHEKTASNESGLLFIFCNIYQ